MVLAQLVQQLNDSIHCESMSHVAGVVVLLWIVWYFDIENTQSAGGAKIHSRSRRSLDECDAPLTMRDDDDDAATAAQQQEQHQRAEPQTLGDASTLEICGCSWTGGKDCSLALLQAWRDPTLHVTCLVVFVSTAQAEFAAHPLALMQAQADAVGLPLIRVEISEPFRDAYVQGLRLLRDLHGVHVVVTGDMDRVGTSTTNNWMTECCEQAGNMRAYHPLWQAHRRTCLDTLLAEHFHVVFSCVKQPWFDASWCGRRLTVAVVQEMEAIAKRPIETEVSWHDRDPRRLPLDLGGEQGEFHTMCLDGPLYRHPIVLDVHGDPRATVTEKGTEGEEDRWWTYEGQTMWVLGEWSINRSATNESDGKIQA